MTISPPTPRLYHPRVDIQGMYYGVLYHTHNGGTQLALGRTEAQIAVVWRTVVENLGRKEVDRCATYQLAFVDPAPDLLRALDEKRLAECLDTYKLALAQAACSSGPPPGMRFCHDSEYLSDREIDDDTEYPAPITEKHADCLRCAYGLLWEGDTSPKRQQYAWTSILWNEEAVRLMGEHTNRMEARGARLKPASYAMQERPQRPPAEPTHVLHADFGHHSRGIVMSPIGEVDFGEGFHTQQVLSFVRALPLELPFVEQTVSAWQARLEEEEKQFQEQTRQQWATQDTERASKDRQLLHEFTRAIGAVA